MDTLPLVFLDQILQTVQQVDKRSFSSCRLVCRTFDTITFSLLFHHFPRWLNYEISHRAILSLVHDVCNRPAVMWSPWATAPYVPVDKIWMGIVWMLLVKSYAPGSPLFVSGLKRSGDEGIREEREVVLMPGNFARLSGREDMSENRLRTGQNRFLMHRSYSEKCHRNSYWDVEKPEPEL